MLVPLRRKNWDKKKKKRVRFYFKQKNLMTVPDIFDFL